MAASSVIFAEPLWFLALPAVLIGGVGLWLLSLSITRRRVAKFLSVARLAETLSVVDWRARKRRFVLPAITILLLAVVLARPLTGPKPDSGEQRGADLVVALDVSKSMWAGDVSPNRLDAVKEALASWIKNNRTDRIGLVLFAGEAFVQAPLTSDTAALEFVLREAGPESISQGGSSIPKAIETAAGMLRKKDLASRVLLIVSDGENLDGDAITAARTARQNDGLTISTIGVGTAAGAKVPSFDKNKSSGPPPNQRDFVRNEYGGEVVSRLDSQALRAIATVGGGSYYEFEPGDKFFEKIRDRTITPLMEKNRKIDAKNYDEWFQIPLGLAILVMVLEPFLGRSRRKTAKPGTGVPVVKPASLSKPAAGPVVALLLLSALPSGLAADDGESSLTREIDRQIEAGQADEAVARMKAWTESRPTDAYATYNYALTLYKAGRHEEAQTAFEAAEALTEDPTLKARALFQMGNIQTRTGASLRSDQHAKIGAVRAFEQALSYYESQISTHATAAGKHNRDLASSQLETLLIEVGTERTRANTEKTLREAMQAFDRAAELNQKHQPLAEKAREQLGATLAANAEKLDAEADANEAAAKDLSERPFRKLLEARQEIVNRYQEAQTLAPENQALTEALKKQMEKMAGLLTKAAAQQAAPGLEDKRFYSSGNLRALEGASEKLGQALSLSPDHAEAQTLNAKVNDALVDAHVQNGELALGHLRKSLAAEEAAAAETAPEQKGGKKEGKSKGAQDEKQLKDAQTAAQSFQSALTLAPEHEQAKAGLAEAQDVLAKLHADVGMADLAQAEAKMGAAAEASAAAGQEGAEPGEAPAGDAAGGDAAKDASAGKAPGKGKEAGQLRNTAALLEKAASNLGAAAGMQPGNSGYAQGLAKAESLLSGVREKLDAIQAEEAARAAAAGTEPGGEGQDGESGEGLAGKVNEQNGPSEMKSMSSLRAKAGGGGAGGGDSKRYWNRFVKDW